MKFDNTNNKWSNIGHDVVVVDDDDDVVVVVVDDDDDDDDDVMISMISWKCLGDNDEEDDGDDNDDVDDDDAEKSHISLESIPYSVISFQVFVIF